MIEQKVKIHDKYNVEIKLGFLVNDQSVRNDFNMNIWMFIPNSLDINHVTYQKEDFYNDVRNYTRLITPIYSLDDICNTENLPYHLLKGSVEQFLATPDESHLSDFEYHIKMFVTIVKSSLRTERNRILHNPVIEEEDSLLYAYIRNVQQICHQYRNLWTIRNGGKLEKKAEAYFGFGDEFLSNLMELNAFKLMSGLEKRHYPHFKKYKRSLLRLIQDEIRYRKDHHYLVIEKNNKHKNHDFVFRMGLLKKYAESNLFLDVKKKKDGVLAEQVLLSLAAGIAMIFATIISFIFKQKLGAYTLSLFIVLVVSYMLKDRIKDLCRYYFSQKKSGRYFDHKIGMYLHNRKVGVFKEAVDFMSDQKIPEDILKRRNRSSLIEEDNEIYTERTLLYRTNMSIDTEELCSASLYPISGINSILRINLSRMVLKMDNSEFPLYYPDEENGYEIIKGERMYYITLILELQHESQHELKRYIIAFNRKGISSIKSD